MHHQKKFANYLNEELNTEQQQAVLHEDGPLLVIAGAGSGKTRVITSRIIHLLLHKNADYRSIIALTFTNKAAREMQDRITSFLENPKEKPFIGTFHSYCLWLIRRFAHELPLPTFSIMDGDDQYKLLSDIIKRNALEKRVSARSVGYHISQLKNHRALHPDDTTLFDPFIYQIYQAYEREKEVSNCLDFDDLLITVYRLFKTNKNFKHHMQDTVRHILVDEYQDTNELQHALLKEMALDDTTFIADSICAVGDEDQSIYSWRGATVANILHFKKDFKNTTTIKLERNYRSVQPILHAANHIISNNKQRHPKKLFSDRQAQDRIRAIQCMSSYQEGEAIAALVKELQKTETLHTSAILYRAHYQSRSIEEALLRHNIPYVIIGGIQFYERKEIKDLLAYLRLIVNPFDRLAFFRVVNCPTRGLGQKFEEAFYTLWEQEPLSTYHDIAKRMVNDGLIAGKKQEALEQFITTVQRFEATDKASIALSIIIEQIEYMPYLAKSFEKQEAENKMENIKELIRATKFFEQTKESTIASFLHDIALMQEKATQQAEEHDAVQLMTLHAAKGLEFDTVMLSGLEEGVFPSMRSLQEANDVEEERRLFYVGITRAKDRLLLTSSRYRYTYGQMQEQAPSRFLRELPTEHMQTADSAHWNTMQFNQFFAQWLGRKQTSSVMTFNAATQMTQPTKNQQSSKKTSLQRNITTKIGSTASSTQGAWKKNQLVKHQTFGMGIVTSVEQKGDTTYISANFKGKIKKVNASFLQKI